MMKIKFLFPTGRTIGVPFGLDFKYFDPTAMIAAAAGTTNAIIGAAGSMYGNNAAVQDSDASRLYDLSKSVLQRNWAQQDQALALQESQRSREYSTKEREAEQAFIAHQNSVKKQVSQMIAAGVNPAAVFGQAGSGGQIGSAPSAPSLATAALGGGPYSGAGVQSFGRSAAIRDMADALKSLTSSGSDLVQSISSAKKIDSEVNLLLKQAENEEQKAAYSKALSHATDVKLPGELRKQVVEITNLIAQGDLATADAELKRLQKLYTGTQDKYLALQLPFVTSNLQAAYDLKQQEIETQKEQRRLMRSQGYAATQQGNLSKEQAQTVHDSRELQINVLRLQGDLMSREKNLKDATFINDVNKSIAEAEQLNIITDIERQQLERAIKENNTYYISKFFDYVEQYTRSVWYGSMSFNNVIQSLNPLGGSKSAVPIQTQTPPSFSWFMQENNAFMPPR